MNGVHMDKSMQISVRDRTLEREKVNSITKPNEIEWHQLFSANYLPFAFLF